MSDGDFARIEEKKKEIVDRDIAMDREEIAIDDGNDTVGGKIKKVAQWKVPYAIVLGDKELAQANLSIRVRGKKELWEVSKEEFIRMCKEKLAHRTLEL